MLIEFSMYEILLKMNLVNAHNFLITAELNDEDAWTFRHNLTKPNYRHTANEWFQKISTPSTPMEGFLA